MAALPAVPHKGRAVGRFAIKTNETLVEGEAVVFDTGQIAACGADPATVLGFMAHANDLLFDPDPGYGLVYLAKAGSTFWLEGDNDPVEGDIGVQYGIAGNGDVATVDGTETTTKVVTVEDIDLTLLRYEVSIIASVRNLD